MGWKEDERDFQRRGGTIIAAPWLQMEEVEEGKEKAQRLTKETDRRRGR